MSVGTVLKKYRRLVGCTSKEFSKKMEIPYSTYSNYENDNRKPSYETLKKFCDSFNITIDEFLGEVEFSLHIREDREKITGLDVETFSFESGIPLDRYLQLEEGTVAPTMEEIKMIFKVHLDYIKENENANFDKPTSLKQLIEENQVKSSMQDFIEKNSARRELLKTPIQDLIKDDFHRKNLLNSEFTREELEEDLLSEIVFWLDHLNYDGKEKAVEFMELLTKIPEYKKAP